MSSIGRTGIAFVAVIASTALAVGCGSDDSTEGVVKPVAGNVRIQKFRIEGAISPSSTSVPIRLDGGYCVGVGSRPIPGSRERIDRIEVDESPESVTIRAFVTNDLPPKTLCRGIGDLITAKVELSEALGGREILDGSRDPPTPRAPRA